MRERETALHHLKRSGIDVLDLEPAQITIPLINEYIAIRSRSAL